MRTVEDLPFVPTTWIGAKRSCGRPSAVSSRRMRSSPKRMPNSSSESRCSSACVERPASLTSSSQLLRCEPLELVALGLRRPAPAPWPTKPWLASLPSARAISASSRRRARAAAAPAALEVDGVGRPAPRRCRPGHADGRDRLAAVGGHSKRASRATCVGGALVARRPRAAPGRARRAPRRRGRASRAAPARPRSRGATSRLGRRVAQRVGRARASGAPSAGPRRRARSDQISSVTNGITGCASASVSASTCSANVGDLARCPPRTAAA